MTEKMLRDFCDFGLDSGLFDTLKKTLANYNPTANTTIVGIMQSSIFGVGASMLTLFMLLELVSLINRVDSGQGLSGTKIPANALIKFAVLSLFYCNIPAVINGIEAVGVYIASSLGTAAGSSVSMGITEADVSTMVEAMNDIGIVERIFTIIVLLLCWLVMKVVQFILSVTVLFRMVEMWLMLLFSPIPLACIASQEFKQVAINFLKSYAAISLRGAAIIGCFIIYYALVGSSVVSYDASMDINDFIGGFLIDNLLYIIVLGVSVFSSGKIINKILGVF
ncbi:MAG: type IV secretion system protein [Clostridiales bacterium]|nr:type IV secretion system protein [Clostridiales bacterium]